MSYVYNSEPPTKGKIILNTSAGDLEVELFAKEAPMACRNFVQLCMEGYYDGTPFHRIVPKFIVQGGDPTGTGMGGESIYGKAFKDEFHSRLRFSHRGLLGMANEGPNTNRSQFFLTLDETEELTMKNTIFGKVVGDTIFNLLKLGELETDDHERPLYPAKIKSTSIVSNPFDDIIPRETAAERRGREELIEKQKQESKKPKGKKNTNLLSFGGEEDEALRNSRIKSSHDVLHNDKTLLKDPAVTKDSEKKTIGRSIPEIQITSSDIPEKSKIRDTSSTSKNSTAQSTKSQELQNKVEMMKAEIKKLDAPHKNSDVDEKKKGKKRTISALESIKESYLKAGKAVKTLQKVKDSADLVKEMNKFSKALKDARKNSQNSNQVAGLPASQNDTVKQDEEFECDLHFIKGCASCRDTFGQQEDEGDEGW